MTSMVKVQVFRHKQNGVGRDPYVHSVIHNDSQGHCTCSRLIYCSSICNKNNVMGERKASLHRTQSNKHHVWLNAAVQSAVLTDNTHCMQQLYTAATYNQTQKA